MEEFAHILGKIMKKIISEVGSPGIDELLWETFPTFFKDLGIIATMAYKTLEYYTFGQLVGLDPEKRKRALSHYKETMSDLRNKTASGHKTISEVLGEDAFLAWVLAPGFMLKVHAAEKVEVMMSPLKEIERREQLTHMEAMTFPALGIDTESPEYYGVKNAYVENGVGSALAAWINGEVGQNVYAGPATTRTTITNNKARTGFNSKSFSNIFFGNMKLNEAKDEQSEEEPSIDDKDVQPLDLKPQLKYIRETLGREALNSVKEYFDFVDEEFNRYSSMQETVISSTNLSDFLLKIEQLKTQDEGLKNFDAKEYRSLLENVAKETIQNENFNFEEYLSAKPATQQSKLRDDKSAFKEELMEDIFDQNWKDLESKIKEYYKKSFMKLKEDINESFNPDFWEEFNGKSKLANEFKNRMEEYNKKIDDFLEKSK